MAPLEEDVAQLLLLLLLLLLLRLEGLQTLPDLLHVLLPVHLPARLFLQRRGCCRRSGGTCGQNGNADMVNPSRQIDR